MPSSAGSGAVSDPDTRGFLRLAMPVSRVGAVRSAISSPGGSPAAYHPSGFRRRAQRVAVGCRLIASFL